ncbi:hypothetical protein HO173_012964 [Letharia columbiana]|uniref:Uncharacterized protein n=1 Tax=Letharia columbiana TaxID=112416 RepID=A0A8H6CK01_9LECA|nr:uncharacterized protein HO173_012964 [Letharia columbiana]KAF6224621.1 hypothetical protein HO173_012964 [Letharia columbiana]
MQSHKETYIRYPIRFLQDSGKTTRTTTYEWKYIPFLSLSLPFFITLQLASSPSHARSPTSPTAAARIPVRKGPASPAARDLDRSYD